jgi:ribosomal protein S1
LRRSITEYGVFVDIGAPVQGLIHVSEIEGKNAKDKYGKILLKAGDTVSV